MPPRQWGARAAATALHRQGRCAASRAAPRRQKRDFWPGRPTPLRRRQDAPRLAQPVPASGFRAWLPAVEQPAADSDWSLRAGRHRCTAGAAPPVRKGLGRAVWCRQEAWRAARVVGGGGRGPRGWWSTSLRRRPSRRAEPTNYCGPPAGSGHAVPVAGAPKSKPTARQPDGRAASVDRRTNGGGPTPARSHPGRGSLFSVCDELTLSTVV